MDPASISLIIALISEGIGVATEIRILAARVRAGDVITDEEIKAARAEIKSSISDWESSKHG